MLEQKSCCMHTATHLSPVSSHRHSFFFKQHKQTYWKQPLVAQAGGRHFCLRKSASVNFSIQRWHKANATSQSSSRCGASRIFVLAVGRALKPCLSANFLGCPTTTEIGSSLQLLVWLTPSPNHWITHVMSIWHSTSQLTGSAGCSAATETCKSSQPLTYWACPFFQLGHGEGAAQGPVPVSNGFIPSPQTGHSCLRGMLPSPFRLIIVNHILSLTTASCACCSGVFGPSYPALERCGSFSQKGRRKKKHALCGQRRLQSQTTYDTYYHEHVICSCFARPQGNSKGQPFPASLFHLQPTLMKETLIL